jgi:hypothetical protein
MFNWQEMQFPVYVHFNTINVVSAVKRDPLEGHQLSRYIQIVWSSIYSSPPWNMFMHILQLYNAL